MIFADVDDTWWWDLPVSPPPPPLLSISSLPSLPCRYRPCQPLLCQPAPCPPQPQRLSKSPSSIPPLLAALSSLHVYTSQHNYRGRGHGSSPHGEEATGGELTFKGHPPSPSTTAARGKAGGDDAEEPWQHACRRQHHSGLGGRRRTTPERPTSVVKIGTGRIKPTVRRTCPHKRS